MKITTRISIGVISIAIVHVGAWCQVPILYCDFENNSDRTIFENAVEQVINSGSAGITRAGNTTAISAVGGAGIFNGGITAGKATTGENWQNASTDPGVGATDYYEFVVNTNGFAGISVTFDNFVTGTGPAAVGVLYSTNGATYAATSILSTGNAVWSAAAFDLSSISAIDSQSAVTFRIYAFAGDRTGRGPFQTNGDVRIDNLTVRAKTATASKTLLDYTALGLCATSGTASTPTYSDFTLNGSAIIIALGGDLQLGNTLALISGKIVLGSSNLTIGSSGSISGASSLNYMETDSTGKLVRTVDSVAVVSFPVGTAGSYNPVSIQTGSGTDDFSVRVIGSVSPTSGNDAAAVQRTWAVSEAVSGGNGGVTVTLQWNGSEEGASFDRATAVSWRYDGSSWVEEGIVASRTGSDPYTATITTLTNFGNLTMANPGGLTSIKTAFDSAPYAFALFQNYPNPFNPSTVIGFALPRQCFVTLKLHDLLGHEVVTLVAEERQAGYYAPVWDGRNSSGSRVSSGVYFYRLEARGVDNSTGFISIKKMVLMK